MWGQELSGETRSQSYSSTGGEAAADTQQEETPEAVGMSGFNTPFHRERAAEEQWAQIIQHKIKADYLYRDDESEVTPAGFSQRGRDGLVAMLPPAV